MFEQHRSLLGIFVTTTVIVFFPFDLHTYHYHSLNHFAFFDKIIYHLFQLLRSTE
ncbi:hypothetical protein [Bacillus sp. FJAT-44742]|uniref:hypothetical protein n=1 Tax=Bacillus sp. FJAT-44742 TaxID=2014005 RepID=UPI001E4C790B|nr:hypothetical protein [Bacillus sp. FJAT-44742]